MSVFDCDLKQSDCCPYGGRRLVPIANLTQLAGGSAKTSDALSAVTLDPSRLTWVIIGQAARPPGRPLSVVSPIADKYGCGRIVSFVPIATNAPQQMVALFNHLVRLGKQRAGTLFSCHKATRTCSTGCLAPRVHRRSPKLPPQGN
jgi:hypothetical protein